MKVSETLQHARNNLMENGWTKGDASNELGQRCALGALHVQIDVESFEAAKTLLSEAVRENGFFRRTYVSDIDDERFGLHLVARFNDHPATTFNDVIAVYDTAILNAKEREAQ